VERVIYRKPLEVKYKILLDKPKFSIYLYSQVAKSGKRWYGFLRWRG
jgi:hypothetical protein